MNLENQMHLEMGLLGLVLIDSAAMSLPELRGLRPEHLRHMARPWAVAREAIAEGRDVSLVDMLPHVGTAHWPPQLDALALSDLAAYAPALRDAPAVARRILASHTAGQARSAVSEYLRGDDPRPEAERLRELHSVLGALLTEAGRDSTESIADRMDDAVSRVLYPAAHRGLSTGLIDLDHMTGGLKPGSLTILAARPSQGKSVLSGQLAQTAAEQGRALMFSLEDGPEATRMRALVRLSGVPLDQNRQQPTTAQVAGVEKARERLEALRERWLIDGEAALENIIAACWRQHAHSPLSLVVVDQLSHVIAQAPRAQADNRNQMFGYIAKALKRDVAQRLGVPVVLVSQLSRDVTRRGDPRPQLSDLRDSGELEQDADTVIFIHRPEAHGEPERAGEADLVVAKNRQGATGTVTVQANLREFRFNNLRRHP